MRCAVGILMLAALASACGGGGSADDIAPPPTTAPDDVVIATDPSVPIVVEVGHRFAVVLPADPGEGWRWTVQRFDTTRLVALGSEFDDDEARRAASVIATSTTSTTRAPIPAPARGSTTTTEAPPVTEPAGPTVPPLVQIVSFAGRAAGTTSIAFSASQIVATSPASPIVVRWTVEVVPAVVGPR